MCECKPIATLSSASKRSSPIAACGDAAVEGSDSAIAVSDTCSRALRVAFSATSAVAASASVAKVVTAEATTFCFCGATLIPVKSACVATSAAIDT